MTDQYTRRSINNNPIGSRFVNTSLTLNPDDNLVTVTTINAAVTVTLPSANQIPGQKITVKADNAGTTGNAVTINPSGNETIDGGSSESLATDEAFIVMQSDGLNWRVVGKSSSGSPSTFRDYKDFGRDWTETGQRLFFEPRGYFTRTFPSEYQVIMVAPSSGRLLEIELFTTTSSGLTEFSLFRPGTDMNNPYASKQIDITTPGQGNIFDFRDKITELVRGERFSIALECAASAGIISVCATFEWDL